MNGKSESSLQCLQCQNKFPLMNYLSLCPCGGLLEVKANHKSTKKFSPKYFDELRASRSELNQSGVWRFRELLFPHPFSKIISHPEGNTPLLKRKGLSEKLGFSNLYFKHEGRNPTGSFKDRGMTVALSHASSLGFKKAICASTGNTSASLAAYASQAGIEAIVLLPYGKVAKGKLAQALAYGAKCLIVEGNFDDAMAIVKKASEEKSCYVVNSLNPFRIEGQKTIIWELLQDLNWQAPDWVLVPGGNLGNTSAFGKALVEAYELGLIDKLSKLVTVQAQRANPFFESFKTDFSSLRPMRPNTLASAINIGDPVNFPKARKAIQNTSGLVLEVTDSQILEAKAHIDRSGIGCEPASAATLAGALQLKSQNKVKKEDSIVCVLTGHILKDSDIIIDQFPKNLLERPLSPKKIESILFQ